MLQSARIRNLPFFERLIVINHTFFECQVYIPSIKEVINPTQISRRTENEMVAVLQLLVNLSVVDTWHNDMKSCIAYCFDILHMDFLSVQVKVKYCHRALNKD